MYILIKLLLTITVISVLNQTAYAEQLDREALRKNIIKRLPKLNHTKFKALMKRVGKEAPKGYYQCFCHSYSTMGNGIGYSPNRDKLCDNTDPCKGGNWGCTSYPLPSDLKVIERCIMSAKYDDNSTIVDAIAIEAEKIHAEQDWNRRKIIDNISALPNEISGDTISLPRLNKLEKELFEKNLEYSDKCLPTLSKNMENSMIWSGNRIDIVDKALAIASQTKNICEESIAVTLYLSSQQGGTKGEIVVGLIKPWLPKELTLDPFSVVEDIVGAPPVLSKLNNLKSNIELLDREYGKYKSNIQFDEAYQLFQKSKTWSISKQNMYEKDISNNIDNIDKEIQSIKKTLELQLYQSLPDAKYGPMFRPNTKIPNEHIEWKNYHSKNRKSIMMATSKIGVLLHKRVGLLLKKNVIHDYRKPLSQKDGCKKFLKERQKECDK